MAHCSWVTLDFRVSRLKLSTTLSLITASAAIGALSIKPSKVRHRLNAT